MVAIQEKKTPWSNPLTMIFGLVIVGALIVAVFSPGLLNFNLGSETGGKIYEQGSGVGGFLKGIEPTYTMIYGNTLDSTQQAVVIGFSGKYGITTSKTFNEATGAETNAIIVANLDDSKLQEPVKSWISSQEAALVYVDEAKSTLTVIGSTKAATTYAINFLKNNQLCDKLVYTIVVIPINSVCNENIFVPMAKITIDSVPSGANIILGEDGNPVLPMRGKTLFTGFLKSGTYTLNVDIAGYNQIIDKITVSIADQINQKQITKSYTLVLSSGTLLVQTNKEGVVVTAGTEIKTVDASGIARFTLNPGIYSVKATLKNYADKTASATVVAGGEVSARFDFTDADITCTPTWDTGAWAVCIDKVKTRIVIKSNDCPLNTAKPAEAEQCCLEPWTCTGWSTCPSDVSGATSTRTCTLLAGCEQSSQPAAQITKDCPAPTQGMLKISAIPSTASLSIDSVSKTGTDFTLNAGTHSVAISLAGYESVIDTITITAGQTLSKEYILQSYALTVFDDIKNNMNAQGFVIVIGSTAALSDNIGGSDIAGKLGVSEAVVDTVANVAADNMILVGGPCVNTKVAELAAGGKFPYTCANWPGEDFVIFKTIKQKNNVYAVVAGTRAEDTRRGGRVVARLDEFRTLLKKVETRFYGTTGDINSISEVSVPPVTQVCSAGSLRCTGNVLEQCSANAWALKESCPNGCENSACKQAVTQVCTENSLRCTGNILEQCSANAWALKESCPNGCENNACKQAVVTVEPLKVTISGPDGAKDNVPVIFTPIVSGGVVPYTYNWNFGDGLSANTMMGNHTFTSWDEYNVKLIVTDSVGTVVTSNTLTIGILPFG
ncbi:MAG: PEGA domain-containing protein [Candidatus Aenigmatarchaeota archaeon]